MPSNPNKKGAFSEWKENLTASRAGGLVTDRTVIDSRGVTQEQEPEVEAAPEVPTFENVDNSVREEAPAISEQYEATIEKTVDQAKEALKDAGGDNRLIMMNKRFDEILADPNVPENLKDKVRSVQEEAHQIDEIRSRLGLDSSQSDVSAEDEMQIVSPLSGNEFGNKDLDIAA